MTELRTNGIRSAEELRIIEIISAHNDIVRTVEKLKISIEADEMLQLKLMSVICRFAIEGMVIARAAKTFGIDASVEDPSGKIILPPTEVEYND